MTVSPPSATGRRVVLAGAGHAQLHSLKHAAEFTRRGHELVVIAPEPFWYSGLATGMLGGQYPPELDRVDVEALTRKAGGRFVRASLTHVCMTRRQVEITGGEPIPFDALSLTLGSGPPAIPGTEGTPDCYAVKPITDLCRLRQVIEDRLISAPGSAPRIAVAGGGVTAMELAANLDGLARRRGGRVRVTVLAAGGRPLRQLPRGAADRVLTVLRRRGVTIRTGARVVRVEPGRALLDTGDDEPFDLFVNAAGLRPNPVLRATGLPLDARGALLVDETLRCIADPAIHGGGDCIALNGRALTKIGVHAIREAPILFRNLLAAVEREAPALYTPQERYLWIMNLGDGTGLAVRGKHWWHGWAAMALKDWIDRRFLRKYQRAAGATVVA